jgi:hypothetical protein
MLRPEAAGCDPAIVDRIGPYEEWAPLRGETALGPLYVGSDGVLSRFFGTAVLWTSIRCLYVTRCKDGAGSFRVSLMADTGPEGLELTLATRTAPGPEFEERAGAIADRLRGFLADHDVCPPAWPMIDLA